MMTPDIERVLDANNSLDNVVLYAFDEARQKLEQGSEVEPFTIIISNEEMYIESHPGEDIVECFNSAREAVLNAESPVSAYVFCYDGYLQLDDETCDALIAERADKDASVGEAFALIYEIDEEGEGSIEFEEAILGLGEAASLFESGEFAADQLENLGD